MTPHAFWSVFVWLPSIVLCWLGSKRCLGQQIGSGEVIWWSSLYSSCHYNSVVHRWVSLMYHQNGNVLLTLLSMQELIAQVKMGHIGHHIILQLQGLPLHWSICVDTFLKTCLLPLSPVIACLIDITRHHSSWTLKSISCWSRDNVLTFLLRYCLKEFNTGCDQTLQNIIRHSCVHRLPIG